NAAASSTICKLSNKRALSLTDLLNAKSIAAPCHCIPTAGPTAVRPRVGFNPTRLVTDAGIRIDPPPSLAPAIGTTPEATSAEAPPLEPQRKRQNSMDYGVA